MKRRLEKVDRMGFDFAVAADISGDLSAIRLDPDRHFIGKDFTDTHGISVEKKLLSATSRAGW